MGKTTFNGPVRSIKGFDSISVNGTTGAETTKFSVSATGDTVIEGTLLVTGATKLSGSVKAKRSVVKTWEATGAISATLQIADSGAIVLIHGTLDNVIALPAAATATEGAYFDFLVTTAVGSGKTTTIAIPAATGSTFLAQTQLAAGTPSNCVITNAGDTFTFVAGSGIGSRCRITCITAVTGGKQVWMASSVGTPISTVG
tara:strand:+ start:1739 stop:2341 length:603 start_codon:yes stop_codon:yes gene_type:complete